MTPYESLKATDGNPLIDSETHQNALDADEFDLARQLMVSILELDRKGTVWGAIRMIATAIREQEWQVRYLLEWVALEALFGPEGAQETTYRLTQRIGLFLGDEAEERKRIYDEAREGYKWRSKIVHGLRLANLSPAKSLEVTAQTEGTIQRAIRKILTNPDYLAIFDGKGRDAFLTDLLFS